MFYYTPHFLEIPWPSLEREGWLHTYTSHTGIYVYFYLYVCKIYRFLILSVLIYVRSWGYYRSDKICFLIELWYPLPGRCLLYSFSQYITNSSRLLTLLHPSTHAKFSCI